MSQGLYTADLVAKFESYFDRSRSRHFDSPIEEGLELSPADQPVLGSVEYDEMSKFRDAYMAIVGGLLWLANMTRVDIAYSASQLARFMSNPGPSHFKAAIRVLVYLRDTADRALVMRPDPVRGLESFVDSSWATKFSCSGGMFFYYGCLFHWFSKMQRSVTLSSAEAEFFGAMLAAKGGYLHSRGAAHRPRHPCRDAPSVIKCDSKSAVGMAFDPVAFKKTKHILRAAEFLRDLVAREVVSVEHLPGAVMLADILTKAASRAVFVELVRMTHIERPVDLNLQRLAAACSGTIMAGDKAARIGIVPAKAEPQRADMIIKRFANLRCQRTTMTIAQNNIWQSFVLMVNIRH